MALPLWINYIFTAVSILTLIIFIDIYFYLRKPRNVLILIPERIKRNLMTPVIGASVFIGSGLLMLFYRITGVLVLRDLMTIFFDFFMLTMLHFAYSIRRDLRMVSE